MTVTSNISAKPLTPTPSKNARLPAIKPPAGRRTVIFIMLLLLTSALVLMGLVMVLSASSVVSIQEQQSPWNKFNDQLLSAGIGLVLMFWVMRIDYRRWRVFAYPAVAASLILLTLVLVPNIGVTNNDATRWLDLSIVSFQPSELAKLALIFFAADILSRPRRDINCASGTLVPVLLCTLIFAGLLMAQPHFGNTFILGLIASVMLFWAGSPIRYLAATGMMGTLVSGLVVWGTGWRRKRLLSVFDPWSDPDGASFQLLQSLHAITVGGVGGTGLGEGLAKWGFVPYAHSDFIFALIAEELGIIGASLVILLFLGVGVLGFLTAMRAPDRFGMLLAVGITTWVSFQASVNLASVMGLVPVVGVTLPLLSHGGTSLIVVMFATGILLNIARQGR